MKANTEMKIDNGYVIKRVGGEPETIGYFWIGDDEGKYVSSIDDHRQIKKLRDWCDMILNPTRAKDE